MHDTTLTSSTSSESASVLTRLRALLPDRPLSLHDALRRTEMQADRLLRLRRITTLPVPVEVVTALPRITIDYDPDLPRNAASGVSNWDSNRHTWVISVNPDEPVTRQRFTIIHEYKHIIDHYHPGLTGYLPTAIYGLTPTEYIAEYFAGCVLIPGRKLKATFYAGLQHPLELADLFDVSPRAIEVRLRQLGLIDHTPPAKHPRSGYRMQPRHQRRYRTPMRAGEVAA